jgi:hypothetical protein
MAEGKPTVEQQIRAAAARGDLQVPPGTRTRLDLSDLDDPDWWVKRLVRRGDIDPSVVVHPTLRLRREADSFPKSLVDLRRESQVRGVLEDFNARVRAEWRRPQVGPTFPVVARLVPVEPMVAQWRELRAEREREVAAAAEAAAQEQRALDAQRRRRRWRRVWPGRQ